MATRRLTRGRGPSPVPIIVLSVIVVGLLASTIVLSLKVGELEDEVKKSEANVTRAVERQRGSEEMLRKYENLVGLPHADAMDQLDKLKKDLEKDAPLESPDGTDAGGPTTIAGISKIRPLLRAYGRMCKSLKAEVKTLKGELANAREERDSANAAKAATQQERIAAETKAKADVAAERKRKNDIQAKYDTAKAELDGQIEKLKGDKSKLGKQAETLRKDLKIKDRTIAQLKELNDQLKKGPPKERGQLVRKGGDEGYADLNREPADGKILTVEPDGKHVMINIGRRDWVREGMEFRVYDDTNPESRKVKGRLQIRRVYDTISHAKVLEQDELDPILRQMIVVNPAFSPGKTLQFVLEGKFREPNVKRYLKRYPCKIVEKVSTETDYLVIGDVQRVAAQEDPRESENFKLATKLGIPIMKETDILAYLGELE